MAAVGLLTPFDLGGVGTKLALCQRRPPKSRAAIGFPTMPPPSWGEGAETRYADSCDLRLLGIYRESFHAHTS